ncbi:unnamed protein product [Blumeria hordei]|uniref:Autophagy-related protein 14 n=2 Tax=Blumeria hordei TaxID=2867405 RepID=A0A383URK8_BLUHO|nr:UV radiation resistance protein (UVRAG) [Blumeria hordei DH14]SZF01892.1 unnamed protein product [Blumeria hordei]
MVLELQRPLLLPENRKIRHLQGISLRRLCLLRPCDEITHDTATSSSPQISSFLQNDTQLHSPDEWKPSGSQNSGWRSTPFAGAALFSRQKKLEQVIASRVADTFITLHCASEIDPIYISEVVEDSMNPTFRSFDLSMFGPATTRLDTVIVKVWVKREDFVLLMEKNVCLSSLKYIGRHENHSFPPNCILFHLVDGIYTSCLSTQKPKPKPGIVLPTSSYNALMRIINIDVSLQDALVTREELATQINAVLNTKELDEALQAPEHIALAKNYLSSSRKILRNSIKRKMELKTSIEARNKAILVGKEVQQKAIEDIKNAQEKLSNSRILVTNTTCKLWGQRRRICEELQNIYNIEPTAQPLVFKICGLQLPNSNFEDVDEDIISAALGHVAHLVNMLQYYLSIPLPYPISPHGSRAIIQDFISILKDSQRIFPLYMRGTIRFRFDYGVFLLNKNIEWLAMSQGLKVMDIRQTLSNLKYLLYICTAGNTEIPARKTGGIKGLLTRTDIETTERR